MAKYKKTGSIRSYKTLTTDEIISMVDQLICISKPFDKNGDMCYRKIEARLHLNIDGLICRVSFADTPEDKQYVSAFVLEVCGGDFCLRSGNSRYWNKNFVESLKLNLDFDGIMQGVKETYLFFSEELNFWNPADDQLVENAKLSYEWYLCEEIRLESPWYPEQLVS